MRHPPPRRRMTPSVPSSGRTTPPIVANSLRGWFCVNAYSPTSVGFGGGLTDSKDCPFCPLAKTTPHLFLHCQAVKEIWDAIPALQDDVASCSSVKCLWETDNNSKIQSTVLIALLWNIWKHRNAKIFKNETEDSFAILRRCANDLCLWSHTCSKEPNCHSIEARQ